MDNMILEIKTVQSAAFRVLTEALKEILTDANFEFDETGLKIMAMELLKELAQLLIELATLSCILFMAKL